MIEIPLTKGFVAIVDDEDADLAEMKWKADVHPHTVYASKNFAHPNSRGQKHMILHRAILERILGREIGRKELCDHKDHNGLNCTRSNLRLANATQNRVNSRMDHDNRSGFKGVTKEKYAWVAKITVDKKHIYLGSFRTAEEAHKAYCEAAKKHNGEFAGW